MRRLPILAVATAASWLLAAGIASAAPAPVTIDSRSAQLSGGDGDQTVSLAFTNLTDGEIRLEPGPVQGDPDCVPTPALVKLPAAEHKSVTLTVPASCEIPESGGLKLPLSATGTDIATPVQFEVTATPKGEDEPPNWDQLNAFLWSLGILAFASATFTFIWQTRKPPAGHPKRGHPFQKLENLPTGWDFQKSWATNITAIGGLLTGIFASSGVLKSFLGPATESSLALATVGAAIAVAFVAAGPIVLQASTWGGKFTVFGLMTAAVFTLTGAVGQLWTVYASGKDLELEGLEDWLLPLFILAVILLMVYAGRSLWATLNQGTTPPDDDDSGPESAAIKAVDMVTIAAAESGKLSPTARKRIERVKNEPVQRRESALL